MKQQPLFILAFVTIGLFVGKSLSTPIAIDEESDPESSDLDEVECSEYIYEEDKGARKARNAIITPTRKWPNKIIYYKISTDYDAAHITRIIASMRAIETSVGPNCITFVEAAINAIAYVYINSATAGCSSEVGYWGRKQIINLYNQPLGTGCFTFRNIKHEMAHGIGLQHQHVAHNRDLYVTVNWSNIQAGKEGNFQINPFEPTLDYGCGYCYDSLVHYRPYGFAINTSIPTLYTTDPSAMSVIGQSTDLASCDICKIRAMYNCL